MESIECKHESLTPSPVIAHASLSFAKESVKRVGRMAQGIV
jgi:hypothetical protein